MFYIINKQLRIKIIELIFNVIVIIEYLYFVINFLLQEWQGFEIYFMLVGLWMMCDNDGYMDLDREKKKFYFIEDWFQWWKVGLVCKVFLERQYI